MCLSYVHQSPHLCSVCVQLLSQTVCLHAELGHLRPEGSHCLVETHLNTAEQNSSRIAPQTNHTFDLSSPICVSHSYIFLDRDFIIWEIAKLLVLVLGKVQIPEGCLHLSSTLTQVMVHFFQLLLSGQYSLHLLLMEALLFPGNDDNQKDLEGMFCCWVQYQLSVTWSLLDAAWLRTLASNHQCTCCPPEQLSAGCPVSGPAPVLGAEHHSASPPAPQPNGSQTNNKQI